MTGVNTTGIDQWSQSLDSRNVNFVISLVSGQDGSGYNVFYYYDRTYDQHPLLYTKTQPTREEVEKAYKEKVLGEK